MRIVFMGTPEFSIPTLRRILSDGHDIVGVYTRAPKPAGRRGREILKTPVHRVAESLGITVRTPPTLNETRVQDELRAFAPSVVIVVAYGLILPKGVLEAPHHGCLNLHASLLPRWRGAAPVQRAIMAGDASTGVDLMRLEEGLDTGPVALRQTTLILPNDTAGELTAKLADIAANVAALGLGALEQGKLSFQEQATTGITYAHKITKSEADIRWDRTSSEVRNQIHGLSPFPGAFSTLTIGNRDERIKIYRAECVSREGVPGCILDDDMTIACSHGAVRILEGQRPGRASVPGRELFGGNRLRGATFTYSEAVKM